VPRRVRHTGAVPDRSLRARLTRHGALRVPQITVYFWVVKLLSTAMGEATSDFLVHTINPVLAVGLGFVGFVAALILQFAMRRYAAWTYWFAVVMVGVFGTMAADVLHVRFGVPYADSSVLYGAALVAVFVSWQRTERTLSFHTIDTPRREAFYWAAVVATFAMGTALGDLTAYTFHMGYFGSLLMFVGLILIPAIGYRHFGWNPVFTFWSAYVLTRPIGASFADWMGKPQFVGGLGWGEGTVTVALTIAIIVVVSYLAISRADVPQAHASAQHGGAHRRRRLAAPSR